LNHSLPVTPVNPRVASITALNGTHTTVASPAELSEPTSTSLSIITPPAATLEILKQAKEAGVPAVWLQPGSFSAEGLEYAKENFKAAIGGEGGSGDEGWCILMDGEDGMRQAGRDWENKPLPSPRQLTMPAQRSHLDLDGGSGAGAGVGVVGLGPSGGTSPSHTRLPSPPPIPEDQIGPRSPPPVESPKDEPEEALIVLEQLSQQLKDPQRAAPIDRATADKIAKVPDGVKEVDWLWALCRFHTQHLNSLIVALFAAPCSPLTCPEMRASEWQYLCASHDPPKSCAAIDYCCHTLDWAGNTLASSKGVTDAQLTNIYRRLYRIFAHAWFEHREAFRKVEERTGMYRFFKIVCTVHNQINAEGYIIPDDAEEVESQVAPQSLASPSVPPPAAAAAPAEPTAEAEPEPEPAVEQENSEA
jgi:hypothetical protein